MIDILGTRIKEQYENRTRYYLPRRTYCILRLDGKSWHTYTRKLNKPFDEYLMTDLDNAVIDILPETQGAVFAYIQSDECSILLTDFNTIQTSAWFDNNIQKMVSVGASILTGEFNKYRIQRFIEKQSCNVVGSEFKSANFDARIFSIPDRTEVMNYFVWRQSDCIRNSISSVAQYHFSNKELHGKSTKDKLQMLEDKGVKYNDYYTLGERYGRVISKEEYSITTEHASVVEKRYIAPGVSVMRTRWVANGAWKFTDGKQKLLSMIPTYE